MLTWQQNTCNFWYLQLHKYLTLFKQFSLIFTIGILFLFLVFYKHQTWVYNCDIHSCTDNQGYCYTWVDREGGRGAKEVASCLLTHIRNNLPARTKQLILWSDSCGGPVSYTHLAHCSNLVMTRNCESSRAVKNAMEWPINQEFCFQTLKQNLRLCISKRMQSGALLTTLPRSSQVSHYMALSAVTK